MPTNSAWKRLIAYPRWVQISLSVYAAGFLIGTSTHVSVLLHGWFLPHHPLLNSYWTALTFLDPLVVVLLLFAPRAGLVLAVGIMLSDVGVNSLATYTDAQGKYLVDYFVQLQTLFLGFVLGSAPFIWTVTPRRAASLR
jgi:membrane protein HdeD